MNKIDIETIVKSTDRNKLFIMDCSNNSLLNYIDLLNSYDIKVINFGKVLAEFINSLEDLNYLNLEVFDFMKKTLEMNKNKINNLGNDIVAIYNLGILFEPLLELNVTQLLKDFSKTAALIIIWDNQSEIPGRFYWSTQQSNVFLDFSEIPLKKLQYAI
jgi:hypothetical protein